MWEHLRCILMVSTTAHHHRDRAGAELGLNKDVSLGGARWDGLCPTRSEPLPSRILQELGLLLG